MQTAETQVDLTTITGAEVDKLAGMEPKHSAADSTDEAKPDTEDKLAARKVPDWYHAEGMDRAVIDLTYWGWGHIVIVDPPAAALIRDEPEPNSKVAESLKGFGKRLGKRATELAPYIYEIRTEEVGSDNVVKPPAQSALPGAWCGWMGKVPARVYARILDAIRIFSVDGLDLEGNS